MMDRPDDIALISNFPLPPSGNNLYRNVFKLARGTGSGPSRVKTGNYKAYERAVQHWMMTNHHELSLARSVTLKTAPSKFLHLDMKFKFHRSAILTKESKPKKNDTSNRIKALHDVLGQILGIDDCWFWSGVYDKVVVPDDQQEGVEITLIVADL